MRTGTLILALLLLIATPTASSEPEPDPRVIAVDRFEGTRFSDEESVGRGWAHAWKRSQRTPAVMEKSSVSDSSPLGAEARPPIEIRGTNDRNNPLRRQLAQAQTASAIFLRFQFHYDAAGLDTARSDEGEFVVFWLDDHEGDDRSHHNRFVPNIGVHVDPRGRNVFMVRIGSSHTAFSEVELEGDRTYTVVGRLSKSVPGSFRNYDTFAMWVDPTEADRARPAATIREPHSVNIVRWIGFSTGRKTEPSDRIRIGDVTLAKTWNAVLGLPASPDSKPSDSQFASPSRNATLSKAAPSGDEGDRADAEERLQTLPSDSPRQPIRQVDFRRDVYPLLKSRCFACHAGADAKAGYRLDVRDEILGYSSGRRLAVPGQSDESRLVEVVSSPSNEQRMPPTGKPLRADEIALLRAWIDQGLAWDHELLPPPTPESDHWAFQQIERPRVPQVDAADWTRTPVDAFIAARHQQRGLTPSPQASRRTLLRRLSLDLLGLPPTPQQVERFVGDASPDAYRQLVDRLLASPQYGERWGRHWLDLARWAESNGHQHNRDRGHAWRYRDYVIASFNGDKPYDRFLLEQIAGDELVPFDNENLIATGFLAAARYSGNNLNKAVQRNDILVDITNTTASAVLGLTMGCAQCHSHKFDPISARDYYRLQAFFLKGQPVNVVLGESQRERAAAIRERIALFETVHERLIREERKRRPQGEILIIRKNVVRGMDEKERRRYQQLGRRIANLPQTWAFVSPVTAATPLDVPPLELRWPLPYDPDQLAQLTPRLLVRGDVAHPGPRVRAGWPAVFGATPQSTEIEERPRTTLVRWLTDRDNPLTARVWVNRIWQYHFGRGLVADAGNLGVQSPPPTHPRLLDWLACELIDSGWSTKHIHRLILHSNTYRQSSAFNQENAALDPEETAYWRWKPRRLEAEAIRDSILSVSGELRRSMGGPSVRADASQANSRRSVYLFQKRADLPEFQQMFDGPRTVSSCSRRRVSTVATQPLFLLNSEFMVERAARFAQRARHAADGGRHEQIELAFRIALGRPPSAAERRRSTDYLTAASAEGDAFESLCLALLNTNEFLYVP